MLEEHTFGREFVLRRCYVVPESLQTDQGLGKKNSKKTLTNYGCHERMFCLLLYHFIIEGRICLKSIRLDNNRLDFNRFTLHSYCFTPSLPFSWKLLIHIDLIRSNLVYVNRLRVERDGSINTVLKNQIPSKFPEWMWTYNRRQSLYSLFCAVKINSTI